MLKLSLQQARNLHLAAQGLLVPARARATRKAVRAAIERMRLLQIDTIHVVARSPYLVLFSRLGDYEPRWLDEALAHADIFECWAHEACFAPIGDLGLHRHPSPIRAGHWAHKSAARMQREHRAEVAALIEHVRANGAVKSSDFERQIKGVGGWWNRSNEKRWLEAGFVLGELMIARRENFQRVYDLSERVLATARARARANIRVANGPSKAPSIDADTRLDEADIRREFLVGAVRALGITQARWIDDYFRLYKKFKDAALEPHVESGELIRVEVRGWENPGYVHRDHALLLARAARGALRATHTALLSPFDPVVWHRERASAMFGFDYTIECYVPGHKRRYGYFVLPILHRGRLIGRLDAKAHRASGEFEVKAIFLEPEVEPDAVLLADVAAAIQRAANWHQTPRVTIRKSKPAAFATMLRAALRQ
ncbi:winged helix-turn-helix domain-containing protein [Rudaea cellulosilytica]|uniref:winged helix-turn-helix domain-containing protein n=1 Tax=Rudaea cellulosilytica TaxID=540746 RepID=UPI0003821829|nr:crosslink repair DNA glycosylase YcaQ family protein [Rudaea cellulosilytica]